jgi:SAM-dependent methyltransferase
LSDNLDETYWNQKYDTEEFVYTKQVNRFVEALCGELTVPGDGKAIDLAGGEGRNAVWLASRGWQVENIDFSQVALDKYLQFASSEGMAANCVATCASALDFESTLAPVDLAVVAYLQLPEADLLVAVRRLLASVKPGGHLMGVWHSRDNLAGGFGGPRNPDVLPNVATMTEALALAVEAGELEIAVLENREGEIQTRDGLKPSTTLVLLANRLG